MRSIKNQKPTFRLKLTIYTTSLLLNALRLLSKLDVTLEHVFDGNVEQNFM